MPICDRKGLTVALETGSSLTALILSISLYIFYFCRFFAFNSLSISLFLSSRISLSKFSFPAAFPYSYGKSFCSFAFTSDFYHCLFFAWYYRSYFSNCYSSLASISLRLIISWRFVLLSSITNSYSCLSNAYNSLNARCLSASTLFL